MMHNIIILITGMAGTGKSTFAKWLSAQLAVPLVSYDHIAMKMNEIAAKHYDNQEAYPPAMREAPYDLLRFNIEEIMCSAAPLIVDYFFNEQCRAPMDALLAEYNYKLINVHFDADAEVAYKRFVARSEGDAKEKAIRKQELDLARFTELTQQNRDFRYNEETIYVNTNDFALVCYEEIKQQITHSAFSATKI